MVSIPSRESASYIRTGSAARRGFRYSRKGESEIVIRDNSIDVKQTTARFWGVLMAQGLVSAKSNYRSRRYCQWTDRLAEQFADAECLVEQGQAFFDSKNLERVKGIGLSDYLARLVRSLQWSSDKGLLAKRK